MPLLAVNLTILFVRTAKWNNFVANQQNPRFMPESPNTIGVIISTYNNPEWLEKTLIGYMNQTHPADEIIIADDGSGPDTRRLIEQYSTRLPIRHVWHPDDGFQKTRILNRALAEATADYLIFTDQDCVPRNDFVATHFLAARHGCFLSGGYFKLPLDISRALTPADITSGRAFSLKWLRSQGMKITFKCTKLLNRPWFAKLMNCITPARASWNGCNSSGWRSDMLAVNGFNELMQYGGEDREFGERLVNMELHPVQMRYSLIVLHLDHGRPYKNAEALARNMEIRRDTRRKRLVRTPEGIEKLK